MSELRAFVPGVDDVRDAYVDMFFGSHGWDSDEAATAFDRWLAGERAAAFAAGFRDAAEGAGECCGCDVWRHSPSKGVNPFSGEEVPW